MMYVRKLPIRTLALILVQAFSAWWLVELRAAEFVPFPDTSRELAGATAQGVSLPDISVTPESGEQVIQADWTEPNSRSLWADMEWQLDACLRGYYVNDQRIQWSGVEETFGAEAAIAPRVEQTFGDWKTSVDGEFYLNQPFDRNILVDTAERVSYRGNFEVSSFEISQLHLSAQRHDMTFSIGKFETPFGRTYFPLYTNSRFDAPFIRTECILWRETGAKLRYERQWFVTDVAITNGSEDQDPNSSKALVSRLGAGRDSWACGFSVKVQDGIGSESQKQFNNHLGVDSMVRLGPFTLSGEAIYDEYGFRRPGFDPLDITWGRSIYYRDVNYRFNLPVTGLGYYLDLMYDLEPFTISCNYGEYYPQQLGIPEHDVTHRRGIVKGAYAATPQFQFYLCGLVEDGGYLAQAGRPRNGWCVLAGVQWTL